MTQSNRVTQVVWETKLCEICQGEKVLSCSCGGDLTCIICKGTGRTRCYGCRGSGQKKVLTATVAVSVGKGEDLAIAIVSNE